MTLKKSLLGGACLALGPLLLNILSLPAMAYIIRGLGPTAYGQWTMATAMIGVLGILANLGLRGAFVRHVAAEPPDAAAALAEQLGVRLLLAAAAGALAILLCLILGYPSVVMQCAAIAAAAMIVATFATTLVDLLQAVGRIAAVAAVNLIAGILLTAGSILVIWLKMGPVALSAAYLMGPAVSATALTILVARHVPVRIRFDPRGGMRLLNQSRAFTAQVLLNSASSYAEALLLPRLIGAADFGFYIAGTLLPLRLMVIPDGLCTAAYPMLARRFLQCPGRGRRMTFGWVGLVTICCLTVATVIFLMAGPISRVLFPAQPQSCRMVIRIAIWALPLFGIETALGYAINAAGADAAQARASLPAALCNVTLTIVLMAHLGIVGACIAVPLRCAVRMILLTACFSRWIGAGPQGRPMAAAIG